MIRDATTPYPGEQKTELSPNKLAENFPLTKNQLIASCCFWALIVLFFFKAYGYYKIATILDDSVFEEECSQTFGKTVAENLEIVKSYQKGSAGPYLARLGSVKTSGEFIGTNAPEQLEKLPPFVTAVSSYEVDMALGLIMHMDNLSREEPKQFIIYLIDVTGREKAMISEKCNYLSCAVRYLSKGIYPDHLAELSIGAWQPIITQLMLEEFGSVIWISPSQRIVNKAQLKLLSQRRGKDFIVWESPDTEILAYTNPRMFTYLNEPRCLYKDKKMVSMDVMVLYRTVNTWEQLIKPWLKCIMTEECIAPEHSIRTSCFNFREPLHTGCHRYEQSALSIILTRVVPNNVIQSTFSITEKILISEAPHTESHIWVIALLTMTILIVAIYYYRQKKRSADKRQAQYRRR